LLKNKQSRGEGYQLVSDKMPSCAISADIILVSCNAVLNENADIVFSHCNDELQALHFS